METMGMGASTNSQEESRHYGTAGLLSPNTEAKIVDPASGAPLPPNQKGELWLTDLFLGMVPMFHIYGLADFACALLGSGSIIVVMSKFDLVEMLRLIQKYIITYLPLMPPILLAMNKVDIAKKYDSSSLHTIICGGAPMSKESTEEFISWFPGVTIRQCYGLTETMGMGASTDSQEESRYYGTTGLLSPNTEAKIVDPVLGAPLPLPPKSKGELWFHGPYVMKGNFSNPEATSSTLDSDGWLRTGDLCYFSNVKTCTYQQSNAFTGLGILSLPLLNREL